MASIIEPDIRGDPERNLRWVSRSLSHLSGALEERGIPVSRETIRKSLRDMGYRPQSNRKCISDGGKHPDRDAQFRYILRQAQQAKRKGNPVVSVDTKKKELVGNYQNRGKEWHRKGEAPPVADHDFPGKEVKRAYPYGIYDLGRNEGMINLGCDHDTAAFAAASILRWWEGSGKALYPQATCLQILADGGGSNSSRSRLWKWELQQVANKTGLKIAVCHYPPGTSKWNPIEHRLFSYISINWRGKPLEDYETMMGLIRNTTTTAGLQVTCRLDKNLYPLKEKVSDEDWKQLRLTGKKFHKEWNYVIRPSG